MALPAIMAGLQAAYGIYRGFTAKSALDELSGQRRPEFMDAANPLMKNKALQEQQYRQGLTPATRALYQQQQASTLASQQRASSEMSGGQMSNALSRMSNLNVNNGALQLAAQNEAAQRQGMQGMIGTNRELSGLQQRDIGQKLDYRNQMERGYGQAQQQAFQDVLGAGVGYAQMQMAQSEADKNRQFYKDLYGIKGAPPVNLNGAPQGTISLPNISFANQDAYQADKQKPLMDYGQLGPQPSPFMENMQNRSTVPSTIQGQFNMPGVADNSYGYSDVSGNKRLGFINPNQTNSANLPTSMGGALPPSMGGTNLGMNNTQYNPFPANPANLPPSMGGYNLGYGNNRYGIRSFTRPK